MSLAHHRTFGRSGLVVSPLALGTMTFGTARWGMGEQGARNVFDAYVEAGGNFVDTADVYSAGRSEEMVGAFIAKSGPRDRIVLATKSGFAPGPGGYAGGSGAGRVRTALEGSLRRLKTDYVDLYWLHVWDGVTPAEEVLETMTSLVRAGKIRHWGLSNTPAWFVAKLATLAGAHGLPGPIGLQYFYSLANREVEDEHLPLAAAFGMALQPWSPLAYGLLTGKYDRATVEAAPARAGGVPREAATANEARPADDKRLDGDNPFGDTLFTERNWRIVDEVKRIATETGQSPARIALAWVVGRPGVVGTLMGVSRVDQVTDNAAALDLRLSPEHQAALDAVSAGDSRLIYGLARRPMRDHAVFGGRSVKGWGE
jgi:aryl-alcohol dehydrogenase-like predicted oxidoreductase